MTIFQLIMLGASAYFAFKIYEHIQTLKDPEDSQNTEAIEEPKRSAEAFSTFDSSDLLEKADEAMRNDNLDKALAIYSEANIKEPNNGETLFKMGYTLAKQKRHDEALDYFKEALEVDNENPFTHLEMAYVYAEDKEFASARMHLNTALEIDSEFTQAQEELERLAKEH